MMCFWAVRVRSQERAWNTVFSVMKLCQYNQMLSDATRLRTDLDAVAAARDMQKALSTRIA